MLLKIFAVFVCFSAVIGQIFGSSIPMWEYLTKDEKMGYLYSVFKNQVEEYCEFSELENCKDELTKYGLKRLKEMPENHLDEMDPYQRGASSIIWNSMMEGHDLMKTNPKQETTPAPVPTTLKTSINEADSDVFDEAFGDGSFGSQGAASAKIDNVYRLPPPKDFVYVNSVQEEPRESYQTGTALYVYPQNLIGDGAKQRSTVKYVQEPSTTLTPPPLPVRRQQEYQEGPVAVRVYPDGTPVRDTQENVVPQDEDLRQYLLSKVRLPEY